nr:MAG TPA: tail protein [Caudoviricetes sp.]
MSLRLGNQEVQSYIKVSVREPKYQSKTVNPSTTDINIVPDDTYDGLTSVLVKAMPAGSLKSLAIDKAGLISYGIESDGYLTSQDLTFQLPVKAEETFIPTTTDQYITFGKYITGTQTIKGDSNLKAENIKEGISLFGIDGTCKIGLFPTGNLDITSNGEYSVENLSTVNVNVPIPDGYIIPSGSLTITENGSKDVTNYALVDVNVFVPETMTKLITPTTRLQTITPDEGKVFSSVQVKGVDNSIDTNIKAENIKSGVSILGVSGTYGSSFSKIIDRSIEILTENDLAGITTIGENAFSYCTKLTKVTIPLNIITIDDNAFYECESLSDIDFNIGLKTIGNNAFNGVKANWIIIPDGVTSIGTRAFANSPYLEELDIPESVTSIGENALYNCPKLEYYGDSITEHGKYLGNDKNGYHYLYLMTNRQITEITINSKCNIIGTKAFENAVSLTTVTIPDSVKIIHSKAFLNCVKLTTITIGTGIKQFGSYIFQDCSKLTNITYTGTKEQWNAIQKPLSFNNSSVTTITCTDGTITL